MQNHAGTKCGIWSRGIVPRDHMPQVIRRYESCLGAKHLNGSCGSVEVRQPERVGRQVRAPATSLIGAMERRFKPDSER
jgi:hypothetical protein